MMTTSSNHSRVTGAAVAAASLLATLLLAAGSEAAAHDPTSGPSEQATTHATAAGTQPGAEDTFTLVTGDVVALTRSADGSPAGRVVHDAEPVGDVRLLGVGDRFYALPGVVMPLLLSGRLDAQLFELTALDRYRYDDAATRSIPLIMTASGERPGVMSAPRGTTRQRALPSIDGAALAVEKNEAERFWSHVDASGPRTLSTGMGKIWLDRQVQASLDTSVPVVGAPEAWQAGFDGSGTTIAVLDTGIDAEHPDFAGRIAGTASFVPSDDAHDDNGHGTHVASIAAGSGAASGGRYRGVAPGADLLVGKVLNDDGQGALSWIISGMEWAVAQGADVVNLSLGACCTAGDDPLSLVVNQLSQTTGTLFVAAAGNAEGAPLSIGTPAVAKRAVAVSNVDHRAGFELHASSSRGPRLVDYAIKPDIAAPGTAITAARAGSQPDSYVTHTGTSMATPHVAGAAAVLAQQHPDWTNERLADHLQSTSGRVNGAVASTHGAGVVDMATATGSSVSATGDVYLGQFAADQTPTATGEVTLRNDGDQPVTLDLAVEPEFERVVIADYETTTVPTGSVTVTPAEVTIPAGRTATVEVTADRTSLSPGGYYGQLVASDSRGEESVHTLIGWSEDIPSHPLTVQGIERDGSVPNPFTSYAVVTSRTRSHSTYLADFHDGQARTWLNLWDGTLTDQLPEDEYAIVGKIGSLSNPVFASGSELTLDADREVVLDARDGRPIQIETQRPSVTEIAWWGWRQLGPEELFDQSWSTRPGDTAYQLLPDETSEDYRLLVNTRRVAPHMQLHSRGGSRVRIEPLLTIACVFCQRALPSDGRFELADAGDASPEALDGLDLTGKVALVREAPHASISDEFVDTEVAAVADAGAVGMLLAVDTGDPVRRANASNPIWSAVVTAEAGDLLADRLARGHTVVRATVNVPSPYVYDLYYPALQTEPDGIYEIRQHQLATVHTRFHAPMPGTTVGEVSRYSFGWDGYATGPLPTPFERTDYVVPGRARISTVSTRNLGGQNHEYVMFTPELRAGQQVVRNVGGAPFAPGPLRSNPLLVVGDDGLIFDTTHHGFEDLYRNYPWPLAAPDGSGGLARGFTARTQVLDGDQVLCDEPRLFACEITSEGLHRIVVDTEQDRMPLSTRTHTEWTLAVDAASLTGNSAPPLVIARWDPSVDLTNTTPDRPHVAPLHVGYQPGVATRASWDVTAWATFDDGATWTKIHDRPVGPADRALVLIRPPADHNGYVGLRVHAEDHRGNAVDQTIVRAYALGTP